MREFYTERSESRVCIILVMIASCNEIPPGKRKCGEIMISCKIDTIRKLYLVEVLPAYTCVACNYA